MYKYVHVPCLVSALLPIPSRSCNVEAFPIPYLGALERVAHVVGGWSSDTPRPRARILTVVTRLTPDAASPARAPRPGLALAVSHTHTDIKLVCHYTLY